MSQPSAARIRAGRAVLIVFVGALVAEAVRLECRMAALELRAEGETERVEGALHAADVAAQDALATRDARRRERAERRAQVEAPR